MQIVVSVYVSPNYISFLIVSSFSCNFNRSAVGFQSFSEHCFREYSKCRAYQTLLKITCTSIKNNHNKFFIMLKRNSVHVHIKHDHGWAYIGPEYWMNTLSRYNCKFVKYCILSEVCMIKTVPHSIVSVTSDVMFKWYKGWFTDTQICWQDFLK